MKPLLRRLVHDRISMAMVVLSLMLAAFIVWQVARSGDDDAVHTTVAAGAGGSIELSDILAETEKRPVSRPKLAVSRWNTSNGARVLFVPAPELPMLDVRVIFDGGAARDGAQPGLARFTAALIGEGTDSLDADEIAEGFERIGAQFNTGSWRDMALVELRALTRPEFLPSALALFSEVLARPSFPATAVERIRGQLLVGLARDEEEPGTLASRAYMAALYPGHPYGSPPEGTVASVKAIRAAELSAFHQRYYVAANAVIAMVGAIDRSRAGEIAEQVAASLSAGEAAPGLPPPPAPQGGHVHVDFPSQQTHVFVGLPSISRSDPDEPLLKLANQVLGGDGLSSLLGEAVRNQRGLAYSVGSGFQPMRASGPFTASLQTRNDQAGEALGVTLDTLRKFAAEGPTRAQLEDARRQIVGSFPMQFAGNGAIVGTLGMIGFYNLPDDWLEQQLISMERAGLDEVRQAFGRHVPLAQAMVVTLGPQKPVASVPAKPDAPTPGPVNGVAPAGTGAGTASAPATP